MRFTTTCLHCGRSFDTSVRDPSQWCSPECAERARDLNLRPGWIVMVAAIVAAAVMTLLVTVR